ITHYKIFLASPGGLEEERDEYYDIVNEYSQDILRFKNVKFDPCGYEETLAEYINTQEAINTQFLENCDYFILLIWDRIGTLTESGKSRTELEYMMAVNLLSDTEKPMHDIVVFSKEIEENKLRDEKDRRQLDRAKDFIKRLIEKEKGLIKPFNDLRSFRRLVTQHLTKWVCDHDSKYKEEPERISVMNIEDGTKPTK
ncbi:unnamed protein product, partial [marine sediment metagenome]